MGVMLLPIVLFALMPAALSSGYPIQPLELKEVRLRDRFWLPAVELNHKVTLWHALDECEKTGRIENFEAAAGIPGKKYQGASFNDSDVYKVLEGIAYSLTLYPDAKLEKEADRIVGLIAAAQQPDGYLQTAQICATRGLQSPMKERWKDEEWAHELYNVGHMYEAAVAYAKATGKRRFLDVALKNADLICATFNVKGNRNVPGHQEIEIGLVKLAQTTGNRKYLDQARWFLDQRGRPEGRDHLYGDYSQDHEPVTEQRQAVGHSVRAAYMYCGMADVSAMENLPAYDRTLRSVWQDVLRSKLYVTGGIGAAGSNEGFAGGFNLPNLSAYAETCASVANVFWNQRMFQASGDARYVDVLERSLYNGFRSGVGLDGKSFFYPNPLMTLNGASRSPWFDCACCPTNDVRLLPSLPRYIYAKGNDTLYVNLFVASDLDTKLGDGRVRLRQDTDYPWKGHVRLTVNPASARRFGIAVRLPGWAIGKPVPSTLYTYADAKQAPITLKVNGHPFEYAVKSGYAVLERTWHPGDTVEASLPMEARRVQADPRVAADVGRLSIQRGPLVYCAEFKDQADGKVVDRMLPQNATFQSRFEPTLAGGVEVLDTVARPVGRDLSGGYVPREPAPLRLIPYYAWANRGRGEMTVWLPTAPEKAYADPAPTIAALSKVTTSAGWGGREITDQFQPASSDDHNFPYFHWWPKNDSTEWVEFAFREPAQVSQARVYWFQDAPSGGCRLPKAWRVLVRKGGQWTPVTNPSAYELKQDAWCGVRFDSVATDGLRIEVDQPKEFSTGIHEVEIK